MENPVTPDGINQPTSEAVPAAPEPVAEPAPSAYAQPGAVLVIPRVFLNYVVIAVIFLAIGLVIGGASVNALFNANSMENKALIDEAAKTIAQAIGGSGTDTAALQPGQYYDVSSDDDPFLGPADAPVTIIEFGDFRCSYCKRFQTETLQPILADYSQQVKFVFRDYPILGQSSVISALAAQCMNDQGKFWQFHDLAYSDQQNLTREQFITYAGQLSVDVEQFTTCLDSQTHINEISADAVFAQNLGVTGTPAFFINGRFISGAQPYDVFKTVIDEELAKLSADTSDSTS
ncbi:MAG: thioredoxin domain-containing protein [Anaerolineae bacterium]|nr:thioredoxin domain-containing protein [Anaerolineae bacterium]